MVALPSSPEKLRGEAMSRLDDAREYTPNGRNLVVAARRLKDATDDELKLIARRDPSMIREVAVELLLEIERHEKLQAKQ
jgi:hypothetical protein